MTSAPGGPGPDLGPEVVLSVPPASLLGTFNRAGVLAAADVHVALRLGRLGSSPDELVALGAALAVRALRYGNVLADLPAIVAGASGPDEEPADGPVTLPWPDLGLWLERLRGSSLVAVGDDGPRPRPLRLLGTALYLDRYWEEERQVAADLLARAAAGTVASSAEGLGPQARRLFEEPRGEQVGAAFIALTRYLAVIVGGPGTGKTTTIARVLALVDAEAHETGGRLPMVALAAPTGKAAARMAESVHREASTLDLADWARDRLLALQASTVHRLLGRHPASPNRFRHDRHNRLPHDVVIVDETSMMSLSLMAHLLEAVRPDARLLLVGDPQQLASVEAGAVLADIVGPAIAQPSLVIPGADKHDQGGTGPVGGEPGPASLRPCIAVLRTNHRFGGPLAELAEAVRTGDVDRFISALSRPGPPGATTAGGPEVARDAGALRAQAGAEGIGAWWLDTDVAQAGPAALGPARHLVVEATTRLVGLARQGDGQAALTALGRSRLLCAHRAGPTGASTWNSYVETWLVEAGLVRPSSRTTPGPIAPSEWYVGRPVMVTSNDYGLGLFNGDVGVTVARDDGGMAVVFERSGGIVAPTPSRLSSVVTAFAMTAHRAQGSEFDDVVVLLPAPTSRILTRELLYTAITRARRGLVLVGTEEALRAAVNRPVARATGLTARLWPGPG